MGVLVVVLAGVGGLLAPSLVNGIGGGNSITAPDTVDDVGNRSSLALGASSRPIVSHDDNTSHNLRVIHCNDANCSGGGEAVATPEPAFSFAEVSSLTLDSLGNPVVSYQDYANRDLKILHCNDPICAGGDESISAPDTVGHVGRDSSIALDMMGNPVVSYRGETTLDLKVLHCNDANCVGGGESITAPDTSGDVGYFTSLALDGIGNPVISYWDSTNQSLAVVHCNDLDCAGADESITMPAVDVGYSYTSLVLDAAGNPVISYYDAANADLKVLHCNDANCVGGDESIATPDAAGLVGQWSALALDSLGIPVVSYYDETNLDLRVLHCNDANCLGGDESIISPDTGGDVGRMTSLVLDALGYPVVSYYDATNDDLKLLHCGDPNCTGNKPTQTPTPTGTFTSTPTATPTPTATATCPCLSTPTPPSVGGVSFDNGGGGSSALWLWTAVGLASVVAAVSFAYVARRHLLR